MFKALNMALGYNLWLSLAGVITAFLITYFFTEELQGIYFTIISLISIKAMLDAGFSNVILTFVALNKDKLIDKNKITFIDDGFKNISNIFIYAKKRFLIASIIGFFFLQIFGLFFFTDYLSSINILYWIILSVIFSLNIMLIPFFSIIEGLDYLDSFFTFRFKCAVINSISCWVVILLGGGVLCIIALNASLLVQNCFFLKKYTHLFNKLSEAVYDKNFIKPIIKPFTAKVSIAWGSSYFTSNGLIPFIFKYISPITAGKFGLSWALLSVISTVSKQFIIVNRPKFGSLVNNKKWKEFLSLFNASLFKGLGLYLISACFLLIFMKLFGSLSIINRLLSFEEFFLLSILFLITSTLGFFTHFFRAQFKEPLFISYFLISITLLISILLNINNLSVSLIIYTLIYANLIFGFTVLFYNLILFHKKNY